MSRFVIARAAESGEDSVPNQALAQHGGTATVFGRLRDHFSSSLARKFALAVMLANTLLVLAVGTEILFRERSLVVRGHVVTSQNIAQTLAASAAPALAQKDRAELARLGQRVVELTSIDVARFEDATGKVVSLSQEQHTAHRSMDVFAHLRSGPGERALSSSSSDGTVLSSAPVEYRGAEIGRVSISMSSSDGLTLGETIPFVALGYGIALIFIGGLIALLTGRSVTGRLERVAEVADRFRRGEHQVRLKDPGNDEVGAVARGVNAMLDTIAASEQSLDEVFRIASIGAWRYAPSQPHPQLSEKVQEILGLHQLEKPPTAKALFEALPTKKQRALAHLLDAGAPGETCNFTFKVERPGDRQGTCWLEARLEIDRYSRERVLVGVCQDVTERENEAEQLRQAQKMEAVGQLTGGLAHDFNNLLAIIVGNLDLLDEDPSLQGDTKECLEAALSAAWRGAELTKQLLAFSRRQSLAPQIIDLNDLIRDMASLWRRTLGEAIDVSVQLDEGCWAIMADRAQVESALLNLVINARDAMPQGGMLAVETANMAVDDAAWFDREDDAIPAGDHVVITVSDTGLGMPRDVIARAFEPFFTTKNVGEGSGLGLSMIQGFVQQSGGAVRIESEVGNGTSVRIFLPRAEIDLSEEDTELANTDSLAMASETVLLVEDNDGVLRVAARMLKDLGYSVLTATNGPEALKVLAQNDHVDVLFTDVVMPGGMDGFELGAQVKTIRPSIKVLHASGFTRSAQQADARNVAEPVLAKPYRKADLARRLRLLLDDEPHEKFA